MYRNFTTKITPLREVAVNKNTVFFHLARIKSVQVLNLEGTHAIDNDGGGYFHFNNLCLDTYLVQNSMFAHVECFKKCK